MLIGKATITMIKHYFGRVRTMTRSGLYDCHVIPIGEVRVLIGLDGDAISE